MKFAFSTLNMSLGNNGTDMLDRLFTTFALDLFNLLSKQDENNNQSKSESSISPQQCSKNQWLYELLDSEDCCFVRNFLQIAMNLSSSSTKDPQDVNTLDDWNEESIQMIHELMTNHNNPIIKNGLKSSQENK
jgi:hypothetical protein